MNRSQLHRRRQRDADQPGLSVFSLMNRSQLLERRRARQRQLAFQYSP